MLITGQRGYGKTVMLSEFARIATAQGWTVVSETASFGLCDRIVAALAPQGLKLKSANIGPSFSIPGIASASLGAASFAPSEQCALTLREAINQRLKKEAPGKGIVFTIDEAQAASPDDMVALATALQHVIRDQDLTNTPDSEKKGIAFAFAGLPSIVDDLTGNDVLTFLRRSQRRILKEIPLLEVRDAYASVASKSGKEIPEEIALDAARKAGGHPYMIQLVGYYMWRAAERRGSRIIESCDVSTGESDAPSRLLRGDMRAIVLWSPQSAAFLYRGDGERRRCPVEGFRYCQAHRENHKLGGKISGQPHSRARHRVGRLWARALLHAALRRLSTQRNPLARRVAENNH